MKTIAIAILVLLSTSAFSIQLPGKKMSKKKLIEQADYYFFKENFPKSLELYNSILDQYPRNHYVQYHIFVAHQLSDGRGSDMTSLLEYEENEGHTDKFYNYWLGRIHYQRYEFELARQHFQAFLDLDIYKTKEIVKETKLNINLSKRAKAFYNNTNAYEIEPFDAPINSKFTDVSPAFYSNHGELLFVSSRPIKGDSKNEFRIFHTEKRGNQWRTPTHIASLGTLKKENAKIEIVNNDGKLFMYSDLNGGDLYFSQSKGIEWEKPVEFNSQLQNHLVESHFFINDAENVIYFAAKANNGKLDILESKMDEATKTWSNPTPILGDINSEFDDDYPFLSHDGNTLYFSSNRPESIGGFDVFESKLDTKTGKWGRPSNMGFPLNTIDNETNYQLNEDNISGFLSSDRLHGQGDYDIYYFHKQGTVLASGKVYDDVTGMPLENAKVEFHPVKYDDEIFRAFSNENGEYKREIFESEDFVAEISYNGHSLSKSKLNTDPEEHHKLVYFDFHVKVTEESKVQKDFTKLYEGPKKSSQPQYESLNMIGSKFRSAEKVIIQNIYFDLHSTTIKEESQSALIEIEKILNENKSIILEISGHTCNIGTAQGNLIVSKSRADNVKSHLVARGIDTERLITKGYGQTKPLASNDDEEEGRELNRRIELKVIQ